MLPSLLYYSAETLSSIIERLDFPKDSTPLPVPFRLKHVEDTDSWSRY